VSERHSTKELFYGYPDWAIAEWCCVHIQTARHWKSGIRKPGPSALKLFMLHRDERILTDEWGGFSVRKGKLVGPEGNEIDQAQLRVYPLVWQLAAEYGRLNPGANEMFARIIDRLAKPQPARARDRGKQTRTPGRELLPRVTPNPSTLPTMILPRSTRKRA
jgi:hypothetical protein